MVLSLIRYEIRKMKRRLGAGSQSKRKRQFYYNSERMKFFRDLEYTKAKNNEPVRI